jgi:hypothetical protein
MPGVWRSLSFRPLLCFLRVDRTIPRRDVRQEAVVYLILAQSRLICCGIRRQGNGHAAAPALPGACRSRHKMSATAHDRTHALQHHAFPRSPRRGLGTNQDAGALDGKKVTRAAIFAKNHSARGSVANGSSATFGRVPAISALLRFQTLCRLAANDFQGPTSSYLVGCSNGRLAGFTPFRILTIGGHVGLPCLRQSGGFRGPALRFRPKRGDC